MKDKKEHLINEKFCEDLTPMLLLVKGNLFSLNSLYM